MSLFSVALSVPPQSLLEAQDAPASPTGVTQSTPTAAEQEKFLAAMRQYAAQYVSNLPDFLCLQVTRQLEAGKKSNRWHKGDTLVLKLSFNQGRELRSLDSVNGKPVEPGKTQWHSPLRTEGEFGILISRVFGRETQARFTWSHWEILHGKRLAVFDFSVEKRHSSLTLTLSDLAKAVVPYYGSVYADPETGAVWRIADTASNIPAQLRTREISTVIDYEEIPIGGKKYLLPVEAVVSLLLDTKKVRNEMEFREYRKFEADSAITFGSIAPESEAAKPKSSTDAPK